MSSLLSWLSFEARQNISSVARGITNVTNELPPTDKRYVRMYEIFFVFKVHSRFGQIKQ